MLRHDSVEGVLLHGQIEGELRQIVVEVLGHGAGLESVGEGISCGDAEEGFEKPMVSSEDCHRKTS